ncbi:hypothetical protein [Micromonospora cathayae]|uniref:Abortive infection protein n=1 Tax=Micromonospora cathayae TaxID=3028804 RepID=A0ABY7ZW14_9ACTN|nr:hypothetical protein [Micromonospora sp. HUAS 3]WDZ86099.1 hypothetical protein PVK37_06665 [Micromonospora sp. HUAS 3]
MLRGRGITYDTGFLSGGATSGPPVFDADAVRRDLRTIRTELHCTAVRVTGGDQDRLELAATIAAEEGLEVWYSPFTTDLDRDEMLAFLADTAERAERIRRGGAEVVVAAGAEASLFVRGFLPGETFYDRLELFTPSNTELPAILAAVTGPLNDFLRAATATIRERFGGKVTYASLPFENVDWSGFDYLGIDFYPNMVEGHFPGLDQALHPVRRHGKPIAITEVGTAPHTGSSANAGHSFLPVEYDGRSTRPLRLSRELDRNETEQATYLGTLLDVLDARDDIDTVFVQTFANFHLVTRDDPQRDLDRASFGLVKVRETPDGIPAWEPKEAFATVAARYARTR